MDDKALALSRDEVARVASLARLQLSAQEQDLYAQQLGDIVAYIDQLSQYETLAEEPVVKATLEAEDVPRPTSQQELDAATSQFINNAPDHLDTFFMVPQVKATGD